MQSGESSSSRRFSHPLGHRASSAVGVPLELNRAWASQPDTCCHMTYTPWANKGILCIVNLFALIVVQQSNLVMVYQLLTPRSQLSVQLKLFRSPRARDFVRSISKSDFSTNGVSLPLHNDYPYSAGITIFYPSTSCMNRQ